MNERLATALPAVARRRVYYLAGFDTRSARAYHQLYRDEAARQQRVNGCRYDVGDSRPSGEHATCWRVRQRGAPGGDVDLEYVFLAWNDVVHAYWPRSVARLATRVPAVYRELAGNGLLAATRRLSRPFFWMMMLPLLYTLAALLAGLLAGAAALAGATLAGLVPPLAAAAAALAAAAGLGGGLWLAEHQRVYWLLRAWIFMLAWGRGEVPALAPRWEAFARRIDDDQRTDPVDETLIVGHSAGAMVAISVAERWLALQPPGGADPRVKLMTIGNATPLLGLIPQAEGFREQIRRLGRSSLTWVDWTAPTDPLCYALVTPFDGCGIALPPRPGYRAASSRFDRMVDPDAYRRMRRDFFRIHFQYLHASDRPVANDYFSLTAGPRPLHAAPPPAA